jgi:hypothetical protein
MGFDWSHNMQAQIAIQLSECVGADCVVTLRDIGERRAIIEEIAKLVLGTDLEQSSGPP